MTTNTSSDPNRGHGLIDRLIPHKPPKDQATADLLDEVRARFLELGHWVIDVTPPGPDQTLAGRSVADTCQATIAAIVRNQEED